MVYIAPREGILATPKHFTHGKFSVGKPAVSRTMEFTPTGGLSQWGENLEAEYCRSVLFFMDSSRRNSEKRSKCFS